MRLEHVALWCCDVEQLRTFYQTYFGARANAKYVNEPKQFESYFLTFASGARLEIMQRSDIQSIGGERHGREFFGYAHIAFSLGSEMAVDELTARLVADGFEHLDGPRRTGDGYYESVILDPEGNRIEITE